MHALSRKACGVRSAKSSMDNLVRAGRDDRERDGVEDVAGRIIEGHNGRSFHVE